MLVKPTENTNTNKKISMIIAGVPGIGKTTFACSSPRPLVIDLDDGMERVEAKYRRDSLKVSSYDELLKDLKEIDLKDYETLVIDTGGKLLDFLKPVVIKDDPKNGKTNGELSLAGYGAVKRKFKDNHKILQKLEKHIIYIFHATEVQLANDIVGLRIRIEGSSKDEVWDDMDLGCFMEMVGNKRTISFNNCDRFYAKGTHGIHGTFEIPLLNANTQNDFLTKLFNKFIDNMNKEVEDLKVYETAMANKKDIENAKTLDELNVCWKKVKEATHKLTSKEELWFALTEKAKKLGGAYDRSKDLFDNSKPSK